MMAFFTTVFQLCLCLFKWNSKKQYYATSLIQASWKEAKHLESWGNKKRQKCSDIRGVQIIKVQIIKVTLAL